MQNGITAKRSPGSVRDSILDCLQNNPQGQTVEQIQSEVSKRLGATSPSSVRSYLRLNTPGTFRRIERGRYALAGQEFFRFPTFDAIPSEQAAVHPQPETWRQGKTSLVLTDCFQWIEARAPESIHAVVTDPPYGLVEYSDSEQEKMRSGNGGVWRIPPSFDGHRRSPLPRFTVLSETDLRALSDFFLRWGRALGRILVPGAHVIVASNPLLSYLVAAAVVEAGLERRGEIIRLTMTLRGGDRPKAAHDEFPDISVMPRSMWEPWLIFRKPLEGRVQDNLRKWWTGGFRRPEKNRPFGDVIESQPTRKSEKSLAPHPSLKPQNFLRQVARAVLPLGKGIVLDPFAGSGSTLAAAEVLGYESIGIERDARYFELACKAIPKLCAFSRV